MARRVANCLLVAHAPPADWPSERSAAPYLLPSTARLDVQVDNCLCSVAGRRVGVVVAGRRVGVVVAEDTRKVVQLVVRVPARVAARRVR